jgi:hypothetical protein
VTQLLNERKHSTEPIHKNRLTAERKLQFTDLIETAANKWSLCEEEVRKVLKNAGFEKWNPVLWDEYLNTLRWFWIQKHIEEAKAAGHNVSMKSRKERLIEQEQGLMCIFNNGYWQWVGTQEQMDAHWELEDLERREKIRKFRRRLHGFQKETDF